MVQHIEKDAQSLMTLGVVQLLPYPMSQECSMEIDTRLLSKVAHLCQQGGEADGTAHREGCSVTDIILK